MDSIPLEKNYKEGMRQMLLCYTSLSLFSLEQPAPQIKQKKQPTRKITANPHQTDAMAPFGGNNP